MRADDDADAQPPAVSARAVKAQRTIDRKAQAGAENKPVDYDADDIRSVWGDADACAAVASRSPRS